MKKRTKIFCGVAILIAIVSMNIRHAWMNYGIAENKIAAGVMADIPAPKDTINNNSTNDTIIIYVNRQIIPVKYIVNCKVAEVFYYYKYINGRKTQIATGKKNLRTGQLLIQPHGTDINGAIIEEGIPIYDDLESMGQTCGKHEEGTNCAPKSAELNCAKLLSVSI